jgi:hypothetical protein
MLFIYHSTQASAAQRATLKGLDHQMIIFYFLLLLKNQKEDDGGQKTFPHPCISSPEGLLKLPIERHLLVYYDK